MGGQPQPSITWFGWVWVGRRGERKSEQERLVGDGPLVWHEEAREGGVLTVAKEALRCSARNFSPIPPPCNRPTPPYVVNPRSSIPPSCSRVQSQSVFPPSLPCKARNVPTQALQPVDITLRFSYSICMCPQKHFSVTK